MYYNKIKAKVDKEKNKVTISLRISEDVVITQSLDIQEFNRLIAEYEAQLDQE